MVIKVWQNFKKKINSTKRPPEAEAKEIKVTLKNATSRSNPVFILNRIRDDNGKDISLAVNYVKWGNIYYFVGENVKRVSNDLIELPCQIDRLATFKDDILKTNAYVEYSSVNSNPMIPDNRLTFYNDNDTRFGEKKTLITDVVGSIILTVAGDQNPMNPSIVGFTSVYSIPTWNSGSIAKWLYADDVITELKKIFSNPYDAIISAHWVPWEVTTPNPSEPILIGNKTAPVGCEGYGLGQVARIKGEKKYLVIPRKYNDWRDYPPYSKYKLYLPFIGAVDFDITEIENTDTMIDITTIKDPIAGTITYHITSNTSALNEYYTADVRVPLAVGQSQTEKVSGAAKIVAGLGAIAAAGSAVASGGATAPATVAALGGVSAIGSGIASQFAEHSSGSGLNGSFALGNSVLQSSDDSIRRSALLVEVSHTFVDDNLKGVAGKPVMKVDSLTQYTGYVKCAGASIDLDGYEEDKARINEYLNSGIYIE